MLRRIVSAALCLALLLCPLGWAEVSESHAAVTIDGVRAAFFGEDGAYLAPLEQDGVVYVPALSLGESLGLAVTADADTLAVTIDGVRVAFFDGDEMIPPMSVDGVVYVPLAAFAESAGLALTVEGDRYAITRSGAAQPAPQPEPVELYG